MCTIIIIHWLQRGIAPDVKGKERELVNSCRWPEKRQLVSKVPFIYYTVIIAHSKQEGRGLLRTEMKYPSGCPYRNLIWGKGHEECNWITIASLSSFNVFNLLIVKIPFCNSQFGQTIWIQFQWAAAHPHRNRHPIASSPSARSCSACMFKWIKLKFYHLKDFWILKSYGHCVCVIGWWLDLVVWKCRMWKAHLKSMKPKIIGNKFYMHRN